MTKYTADRLYKKVMREIDTSTYFLLCFYCYLIAHTDIAISSRRVFKKRVARFLVEALF